MPETQNQVEMDAFRPTVGPAFPQQPSMLAPPAVFDSRRQYFFSRRPEAPRSVVAQDGSFETLITWNPPADLRDVVGFIVYQDSETSLVWQSRDNSTRQVRIKLPSDSSKAFFIASVNSQGRLSNRVFVIGSSNNDKYVVNGTDEETGGTSPNTPPEWEDQNDDRRR